MDKSDLNVFIAFLLGAAAGGVAALLLAPASGTETRKKIKDTVHGTKNKAVKGLEGAKDFAEVQKEALKEAVIGGKEAYRKAVNRSSADAAS
jgi:gas vesicle protein